MRCWPSRWYAQPATERAVASAPQVGEYPLIFSPTWGMIVAYHLWLERRMLQAKDIPSASATANPIAKKIPSHAAEPHGW